VYQCLQTILDVYGYKLNLREFIVAVQRGVADQSDDVLLQTYKILEMLSESYSNALVEMIDTFPDLFIAGALAVRAGLPARRLIVCARRCRLSSCRHQAAPCASVEQEGQRVGARTGGVPHRPPPFLQGQPAAR
jgi:hypothetical protein